MTSQRRLWLMSLAVGAALLGTAYLTSGFLRRPWLYLAPGAAIGITAAFWYGMRRSSATSPIRRLAAGGAWVALWLLLVSLPIAARAAWLYYQVRSTIRFDRLRFPRTHWSYRVRSTWRISTALLTRSSFSTHDSRSKRSIGSIGRIFRGRAGRTRFAMAVGASSRIHRRSPLGLRRQLASRVSARRRTTDGADRSHARQRNGIAGIDGNRRRTASRVRLPAR